jgi:hypothetical protein
MFVVSFIVILFHRCQQEKSLGWSKSKSGHFWKEKNMLALFRTESISVCCSYLSDILKITYFQIQTNKHFNAFLSFLSLEDKTPSILGRRSVGLRNSFTWSTSSKTCIGTQ